MKYIIQIGVLYDKHYKMVFGYVGKDLETGEIHYYAKYDNLGHYSPNCLSEFNINRMDYSEQLSRNLRYCDYIKANEMISELPKEILPLTSKMINKHLIYNKENGYPIEFLTNNSSNLSVEYTSDLSLFGGAEFSGRYVPVQNTIDIPITANEWNNYSDQQKKAVGDMLLHETGHLKVSTHRLDMSNKQLNIRTGFYSSTINVVPIVLANEDIFLKPNENNILDNAYGRILEEIMNDFDCIQINPNFNPIYPNVGHVLNELCDGRLQVARYYDDGIEELYERLFKLIESRDMVDELLESIKYASKYDDPNCEENNRYMMKLLNQYHKIHSCK